MLLLVCFFKLNGIAWLASQSSWVVCLTACTVAGKSGCFVSCLSTEAVLLCLPNLRDLTLSCDFCSNQNLMKFLDYCF